MDAPNRDAILGTVEVAGEIYLLAPAGVEGCYEAIRLADQHSVGTIGTSGWMWRLHSETPELMQDIVQAAIECGLVQAPPAD
jgi:hypothetical protein